MILEQIIDEELVVQDARAGGLIVSQEQIHEEIQRILSSNQISILDLQQNLEDFGISMEQFERLIERQILISQHTKDRINLTEPTDAQLQNLYELKLSDFKYDAQVTVKHVLVANQREAAAVRAKEVYDRVVAGDDFCDLVEEYTDDRGSLENCGEYTFAKGFMVPEFEEASFTMDVGETQMVQTVFGYHIITKLADLPPGVLPLSEVRDQLSGEWANAEYVKQYRAFTDSLRAKATIVYFKKR